MSRIDVTDKDPFANADAEPKDNVSSIGFLARFVLRFGFRRLITFLIFIIILYIFGFEEIALDLIKEKI
jgi:hypothetical protein|tara:strand:- start:1263 stop:1469 length:207 start_codon:yes stop_codon:yes gene_type:complete